MPLKVQLDQRCRRSSVSNTSGLLLGTAPPHPRILFLIPTPETPSATSSHRWAVEHANLIRPICPAGLSILGTYLPLRGTSSSPTKQLDAAAAIARDIAAQPHNPDTSFVLCRGPKGRVIVKQVEHNHDQSLKTADLKELPELTSNIVSIQADLSVPQTLFPIAYSFATPVEFKSACCSIADTLVSGIVIQLPDQLRTIVTTIDDSRNLAEIMAWNTHTNSSQKPSSFSHDPLHVQIFTPVSLNSDQQASTAVPTESRAAFTSLQGTVHLEAIATLDSTVGDVLNALQEDLVRSLRTRVELLIESYLPDEQNDSDSETNWNQPSISAFPARVVATPVLPSSRFLSLTEYLMPAEEIDEDLTNRFLEAFSWDKETLEEFKVEQKERHYQEDAEGAEISSLIAPRTDESSLTESSDNAAIDIQYVMQTSLIAAFIFGFLAVLIKELLNFW